MGWCGQVLDTNGDGRITRPWNVAAGRGQTAPPAFDAALDTEVEVQPRRSFPAPWRRVLGSASEQFPGFIVRVDRGSNPPSTCKAEVYKVPDPGLGSPRHRHRSQRRRLDRACREQPSRQLRSPEVQVPDWSGESRRHRLRRRLDALSNARPQVEGHGHSGRLPLLQLGGPVRHRGLGANTPFATGSNSDSLLALNPQTRQWTTLRVPYPLGFYSRGMDGRIDDPNAGWKGRALYANYGTHFVWHIEGGKGTKGKLVKFQIRPDPLAR